MTKCNEGMTKDPVGCLPDDSMGKAAKISKSKLVGIVTGRDLALTIVAEEHEARYRKMNPGLLPAKPVRRGTP